MRNRVAAVKSLQILIVLVISVWTGCGQQTTNVPVTTGSDRARELYIQGRELAENVRLIEARAAFEEAIKEDPDFAMAHLQLAFTQPTTAGVFASLDRALDGVDSVSDGERLFILAAEAGANNQNSAQQDYLEQLVQMYPRDKRTHLNLGNFYFGQQQYLEAIAELRKAKQLDENFAPPYNMLGYSYRLLGKYRDAEEAFKTYVRLIPDDPNPYDSYAELLMKIGEFKESIESYQKALEIDSNFINSHIGIAANLTHLNRHEDARKQLQVMYDEANDDGVRRNALLMAALTYLDEGKFDETLDALYRQMAIAEQAGDSGAVSGDINAIGIVLIEVGRFTQALESFQRSVSSAEHSNLTPEAKETARRTYLFNLTALATAQGNLDLARSRALEYFQLVQTSGTMFQIMAAHQLFGRIAIATENWEVAIEELSQTNQQNPYNIYWLALAYERSQSLSRAKTTTLQVINYNQLLTLNYMLARRKALELYQSL